MNCNPYQEFLGSSKGAIGRISADFAENNLCGYVAQPANVISSIAYIVVGIVLYNRTKNLIYLFLYTLLGLGSIALHASASQLSQFIDFGGMFLVIMYLFAHTLKTSTNLSNKLINIILVSTIIFEFGVLIFAVNYRILVFAFVLLSLLIIETRFIIKQRLDNRLWVKGWVIFLISFIIWLMDEYRLWDIDSIEHIINAHVFWHIGTAYALYLVSVYYINKTSQKTHKESI